MLSDLVNPALNSKVGDIAIYSGKAIPIVQLLLRVLIDLFIGVGGLYFFFQLFIGGYNFITAGGDKDTFQKAQLRIRNSLIGIIVILSTFAAVYVIETVFGINIRNINIPTV